MRNLHLDKLRKDVREVKQASEALFASLSPEQLTWKPDNKTWSIIQIFDHVLTTNRLYIPKLEKAIDTAERTGKVGVVPFKPSFLARLFIRSLLPESRMKLKTFRVFKPERDKAGDLSVTHRFIKQQDELIALLERADSCDVNAVKFSSPATRLVRFSIGEGVSVLVVHEQRHLLQAQNRQLNTGFPEFKQVNRV